MFRPILFVLSLFITFALTACEERRSVPLTETQIAERKEARAQRRIEREARRITQGEEIVAACRATQCPTLNLDWKNLSDFTVLNDMRHVKVLMLSGTEISNLSDITGMTWLDELHLRNTNVKSLAGISKFTNLQLLHLGQIAEADQREVGQLRQLKELAFGIEEGDLSFLSNLSNLTDLSFGAPRNVDFSPLARLDNVERLDLGAGITSISPLLGMDNLKVVTIFGISPEQSKQLTDAGVEINLIVAVVVC